MDYSSVDPLLVIVKDGYYVCLLLVMRFHDLSKMIKSRLPMGLASENLDKKDIEYLGHGPGH